MDDIIYTHDEASRILEWFDDLLSEYGIVVPSPEDDQREEDNCAALYGSTYADLMDRIENALVDLLSRTKNGAEVIPYAYSGRR